MSREDIDAALDHALLTCEQQGASREDLRGALSAALYRVASKDYLRRKDG